MLRPALLVTAALSLAACGGDTLASDDFSYSDEEWSLESISTEPAMRLAEDATYDGPALCGSDHGFSGSAELWKFNAPNKYLGNVSRIFGRRLTWDSQTSGGRQFQANDLYLNGRGISLVTRVANTPSRAAAWQSFSVWLDTSKTEWTLLSGEKATDDDLKAALAYVTSLRLPGEWRNGEETTCIDNVYFGTP
ncbi:MAG: hypothetical protein IPJ65_35595 [Archangiaceae bacterium]|nr:hypothetical protein [Archangiaceae bacterium]